MNEVNSSVKWESTANSTIKSSDVIHRTQGLEISVPSYLVTERVEEESSPMEAGSALLKDLSTHRDSILSKPAVDSSNKGRRSSQSRYKVTDASKRYYTNG